MDKLNCSRPDPRLAGLLAEYPAALFNQRLYQSIEWAERYGLELAIDSLQRLGAAPQLAAWRSVTELGERLNFTPRFQIALAWLLERLAAAQLLSVEERNGARYYQAHSPWRSPELDQWRAIGLAIDPANTATLNFLEAAAAVYPRVARGEISGEEALFAGTGMSLWLDYFHNRNPLYAVNNWVSAMASAKRLASQPKLRILEVGAGAGSASEALLDVLAEHGLLERLEQYLITEPSPFLRRRCQRALKAKYSSLPLEFAALDIDQPWDRQGAAQASFNLVYSVNTLHVAKDLSFSLRQALAMLAPEGWLAAGECLRPFPGQPIYIELVFQILDGFINVTTNPDFRPTPGFLTAEQWRRALACAGFTQVQITPDQEQIRAIYPRLLVGAICAQ